MTAAIVVKIFSVCMGVWAMGYGVGQAVAWVGKIKDVA